MITNPLSILFILGWGSIKYLVALGLIFYYDYNFGESMILAITGSMMGVLFFSYTRDALKLLWYKYVGKPKQGKQFRVNWRTRLIVRTRQRFGLAGIAFLTPILLTIPVGTLVALSMYRSKPKVFSYMLVSFTFWSLLLIGAYQLTGFDLAQQLHNMLAFL
ncbi:MAG: hypothetical protein IPN94_06730 [Sphingobacteriales bacterium]|jgi:hypothetical protein|nr:hypothetical protein [Sphingobacteriales bacterium]